MIVVGPPGVGKSFGVERVLGKHDLMANIANDEKLKKYEIVKGAMSAIGLYSKLYEFSAEKNILVFDDCDSVLLDDLSLNILKAAWTHQRSVPFTGTLTADSCVKRVCPTVLSSRVVLSSSLTLISKTSRARNCRTVWLL